MMYHWNGGAWGAGAWVGMALMMIVFWGAVAALVVYVVRASGRRDDGAPAGAGGPADAARVLDERFARGDIDVEEYTTRRDALRGR